MKFVDKAGREILPGDLIVYGHALGRSAALQYGKALEILPDGRLRVQGVEDAFEAGKYKRPASLLRPGFLKFGNRVLKVDRSQTPMDVLILLDSVRHDRQTD